MAPKFLNEIPPEYLDPSFDPSESEYFTSLLQNDALSPFRESLSQLLNKTEICYSELASAKNTDIRSHQKEFLSVQSRWKELKEEIDRLKSLEKDCFGSLGKSLNEVKTAEINLKRMEKVIRIVEHLKRSKEVLDLANGMVGEERYIEAVALLMNVKNGGEFKVDVAEQVLVEMGEVKKLCLESLEKKLINFLSVGNWLSNEDVKQILSIFLVEKRLPIVVLDLRENLKRQFKSLLEETIKIFSVKELSDGDFIIALENLISFIEGLNVSPLERIKKATETDLSLQNELSEGNNEIKEFYCQLKKMHNEVNSYIHKKTTQLLLLNKKRLIKFRLKQLLNIFKMAEMAKVEEGSQNIMFCLKQIAFERLSNLKAETKTQLKILVCNDSWRKVNFPQTYQNLIDWSLLPPKQPFISTDKTPRNPINELQFSSGRKFSITEPHLFLLRNVTEYVQIAKEIPFLTKMALQNVFDITAEFFSLIKMSFAADLDKTPLKIDRISIRHIAFASQTLEFALSLWRIFQSSLNAGKRGEDLYNRLESTARNVDKKLVEKLAKTIHQTIWKKSQLTHAGETNGITESLMKDMGRIKGVASQYLGEENFSFIKETARNCFEEYFVKEQKGKLSTESMEILKESMASLWEVERG